MEVRGAKRIVCRRGHVYSQISLLDLPNWMHPLVTNGRYRDHCAICWINEIPKRGMLHRARTRARQLGIPFNITIRDIHEIWPADMRCPVLGILMEHNIRGKGGPLWNSPALDRVKPKKGYVRENIAIMSRLANSIKQDQTDPVVFRKVADWLELRTHGIQRKSKGT